MPSSAQTHEYYNPNEQNNHLFMKLPIFLFDDPVCQKLSSKAKLLNVKLLDTMRQEKNQKTDSENRVYINFSIKMICDFLNCSESTAKRVRKELKECFGKDKGLVRFESHGQGNPDHVYIMRYSSPDTTEEYQQVTNSESRSKSSREFNNELSRETKNELPRETKSAPYNKINDKESLKRDNIYHLSFTATAPPRDDDDEQRDSLSTERLVRETNQKPYSVVLVEVKAQIGFDQLLTSMPDKAELITSIAEVMAQEFISNSPGLTLNGCTYQRAEVESRLRSIDMPIVKYVLSCLSSSKSKVNYIQRYILATLLNAPAAYEAQKAYGRLAEQNISSEHSINNSFAKPNTKHAYQPYIGRNYSDDEIRALELKKLGITG